MLRPVQRTSCPAFQAPLSSSSLSTTVPKVAVLMVYDSNYGGDDATLVPRIRKNREDYCARHGCTVITYLTSAEETSVSTVIAEKVSPNSSSDEIAPSALRHSSPSTATATTAHTSSTKRPPAWSKLLAILKQLQSGLFDYVLYIDMDMVIMNPHVAPASLIHLAPDNQDFIMTDDWSGYNTGIMFVRTSEFSKWFLQTAWDQEQLVAKFSEDGRPHPFEYEQRAFHYLLNSQVWQDRKLPQYRGDSAALRTHFSSLPQCTMNSYVLHPLEFRADREKSHFVPGDFIVHLAGKKGKIKKDLINYYLDEASMEYTSA
jgi:hypothetical protein